MVPSVYAGNEYPLPQQNASTVHQASVDQHFRITVPYRFNVFFLISADELSGLTPRTIQAVRAKPITLVATQPEEAYPPNIIRKSATAATVATIPNAKATAPLPPERMRPSNARTRISAPFPPVRRS